MTTPQERRPLPFGPPSRSARPRREARRARRSAHLTDTLPVWLRRIRVEVLLRAFREGRPVDPVALSAVLGAKHARGEEPFQQWSRYTVRELLWGGVDAWWREHDGAGSPPPDTVAATIWALLDHLDATRGFAPGSDPVALLREPLIDSGGLDRRGRPRRQRSRLRHPSMQHSR
ncbi:MAG TPA: hypothetical protein VF183_16500 [Acidimicrobiales bacterium]